MDNELFSKPGTGTNLKIVIAECDTTKIYLYNGTVYAVIKVNQYTKFYWKECFTVY